MYIVQDVVDLIIDQLFQSTYSWERKRHLQAVSLISTVWVNRSQHHLFSTIELCGSEDIERWRSRIKPGPCGVSRHVRLLVLGGREHVSPLPTASDAETALPHFTSFKNLQELVLRRIDLNRTSLGIFIPIITSPGSTLKRLQWTQRAATDETWKTINTLTDILPNLVHVHLSSLRDDYEPTLSEIKIQLSADERRSRAIKNSKFHELRVLHGMPRSLPFLESCGPHLQALDLDEFQMCEPIKRDFQNFQILLETCHALQLLSVALYPGTARFLGSIPSDSVSIIHLGNPLRWGTAPTTYDDSWPWESFEDFRLYLLDLEAYDVLAELTHLGASIRKVAQRFSDRHPGSKTRVRATLDLTESEIKAVENGGIPLFKTKLEEELGNCADVELILRPWC